jgi:DNA-binding response OmpR family regulator
MQPPVRRIVIADDDDDIRQVLRMTLEEEGYSVAAACDGDAARDLVLATLPDLVVLDVMMPGLDGFEVLRILRARAQTREIPVVLLTAKTSDTDVWMGWEAGASSYLTKPFDFDELLRCIRMIGDASAAQRAS